MTGVIEEHRVMRVLNISHKYLMNIYDEVVYLSLGEQKFCGHSSLNLTFGLRLKYLTFILLNSTLSYEGERTEN